MLPDYHTHTELCQHAEGRPVDYAAAAAGRLPAMACTDHVPFPYPFDPPHRMRMDQFEVYAADVREAQKVGGLPILFGIEADYFEGCEAHLAPWLQTQPFDLVLGSVHYLDAYDVADIARIRPWPLGSLSDTWERYFDLLGKMADSGLYDVVSHLDWLKRGGLRPPDAELREMALPVLDRVARAGMAIEINTSGWHHPVAEPYPSPQILAWARERGIPITFASDAHVPARVGAEFGRALRLARELGFTHSAHYAARHRTLRPLPSV